MVASVVSVLDQESHPGVSPRGLTQGYLPKGVPYSGKLSKGKNLRKFRSFVAICESFLHEILGRGILWHGKNEQSAKVFSAKIHQFTKVFSLESFSLYGND